jgi:hypothetical protein
MNSLYSIKPAAHLSPQAVLVLNHMKQAGSITNIEANAVHRVRSVSRRITEINRALVGTGYSVEKAHKRDVNSQRYVRYSLVANPTTIA